MPKFFGSSLVIGGILAFAASVNAAAPAKTDALLLKGKASYTINCALCHGELGDGNGAAGVAMTPKPRNFKTDKFKAGTSVDAVFKSITEGLPGTTMVGFSHLSEEERWGLAYQVLVLKGKGGAPEKGAAAVPAAAKEVKVPPAMKAPKAPVLPKKK